MLLWNPNQKMWSFSVSAVGSDRGLPSSHLAPTCLWFWPTGGPVPFTLFPSRDVVLLLLFHFPVCIEATRVFMIFFSLSASANFTVKKNKILRARKWNPKRPTEGCAINWNMIDICSPDVRKVGLFGTNPNKRHIVVLLVVFFLFFFSVQMKNCWVLKVLQIRSFQLLINQIAKSVKEDHSGAPLGWTFSCRCPSTSFSFHPIVSFYFSS